MLRETKLVQLRSKTDRDLLILVRRELERALALADVATNKQSPLYAQAIGICETAKVLLPKISGLSRDERRKLELKLKDLQAMLDRLKSGMTSRCLAGASVE
jgi:hypothetical protein